jgi:DNA-binding response OmpR family regulator
MCETCKELKAQIAELEYALANAVWVSHDEMLNLSRLLRMSRSQATIVMALYKRHPHALQGAELNLLTPQYEVPSPRLDEHTRSENTIRVQVHKIREKFGKDFIESQVGDGGGYRLSERARAMVGAALNK